MAGRGQTIVGATTFEEIKDRAFCIRMPDCPAKNVTGLVKIYSVRGIVPPPFEGEPQKAETLKLEDILFALPCTLIPVGMDRKIAGIVTGITRATEGASIELQAESVIPQGTALTLEWRVPEKIMQPLQGQVEKCLVIPDDPMKTQSAPGLAPAPNLTQEILPNITKGHTTVMVGPQAPGTVLMSVKALPPEILQWVPGTLLQTEFKSHQDIIRE